MSRFFVPVCVITTVVLAFLLPIRSAAAQPDFPRPAFTAPAWSEAIPMGGARTLYRDKPECVVSAQNRIDCYALGDAVTGNPASGDAGSVLRTRWDGSRWSAWEAASQPGFAPRDALHRTGKEGRPACALGPGGITSCYVVANFNPGALPQNADVRLAGGILGTTGPALWWGDLGTAMPPGGRFGGAPICLATPNNGLSCAVLGRPAPLDGKIYTRLLSNGLWGPWSEAFDAGVSPFWTCAARNDGRIDCVIESATVDARTRANAKFVRHVAYDPNGAVAGYQTAGDLSAAVSEFASEPQCVNAPDQLICFVLTDTGSGALPVRLSIQHQAGAGWVLEPIGFRQPGSNSAFGAADIADLDCSTGASSNDIDCVVALKTGRIARYSKTAAFERDWSVVATNPAATEPLDAISCRLGADWSQKHCFGIVSSGRALTPVRMRHIVLDSILPALRPLRPRRPIVVPPRPPGP
jgi:hypothetical protein